MCRIIELSGCSLIFIHKMAGSTSRSLSYELINEEQKKILREFYERGMTTASRSMEKVIIEAASKAGITVDRVKKWIGNEKQSRKRKSASEETVLPQMSCPSKRKITAYNLFCSEVLNSEECKCLSTNAERLKLAVDKWNMLGTDQRGMWDERVKALQSNNVSGLSEKQLKNQIKKTKKQLSSQLAYLESLGCEVSVLFSEPGDACLQQFGTEKGLKFLQENEKISVKFVEYLDSPKKVEVNYKVCDVVKLFNQKYSEVCGKPCRVPYAKGGFTVTGLPEGIVFKKPGQYGMKQISHIMKNADNIKFVLNVVPTNKIPVCDHVTETERATYRSVLKKIIDDDSVISSCLLKNILIKESDLNVIDIDLSKSEFSLVTTKLKELFDADALAALVANYKSGEAHQGYILPVYTDTDEPYWLFYYPGSADGIELLSTEDKIFGYWLDKTKKEFTNTTYKLLNEKTCIVGLNVISDQDKGPGTLRLKRAILNGQISIPSSFDTSVLECLAKQDFL
ncbi:uncharacterized protein LOC114540547 [Dendronephthya gigantea]|uniref:uncharacterized protein LOC114540547 n=1 Tax=Dendronephthya gigantea TaxID=151771 RepID=UPI00106A9A2F|nr:uncharacterized protein LOC114540547 [Dendronephthya gigantea]